MRNIRVAILTRTSTLNFGTILQNYALQNYLKEKVITVQTVHDSIPRRIYSGIERKNSRGFKAVVANFLDRMREKWNYREIIRVEKKIRRFTKKNICYYSVTDFDKLNEDFDVFIAGSDQIWSYAAEPALYSFFMLEKITDKKKKLAYAVSIGEPGSREKWIADAKRLLPRFNALSVREEASKVNISPYVEKEINVVCDPVFLLGREQWDTLAKKGTQIKTNYIFGYFLTDNVWYYDYVDQIATTLGYEVRLFRKEKKEKKGDSFLNADVESPEDFLSSIRNAKFVLTDSYHCTLFSLLFEKKFLVFKRFSEENNTQNNRVSEILIKTHLYERMVGQSDEIEITKIQEAKVQDDLIDLINYSKDFLNSNIN